MGRTFQKQESELIKCDFFFVKILVCKSLFFRKIHTFIFKFCFQGPSGRIDNVEMNLLPTPPRQSRVPRASRASRESRGQRTAQLEVSPPPPPPPSALSEYTTFSSNSKYSIRSNGRPTINSRICFAISPKICPTWPIINPM